MNNTNTNKFTGVVVAFICAYTVQHTSDFTLFVSVVVFYTLCIVWLIEAYLTTLVECSRVVVRKL